MSVTHLAGFVVVIGRRCIQRCAICGEKLVDSRGQMVLDTDDRGVSTWPVNELVHVDGNMWVTVKPDPDKKLPDDICLNMVE